jgi:hypothetical protein
VLLDASVTGGRVRHAKAMPDRMPDGPAVAPDAAPD